MDPEAYVRAVQFIDGLDRRHLSNRGVGWVYVMRNNEFRKPLLKVGMTTRPPYERASEMGRTAVPGRFELVYFVHVVDARMAESLVHRELASFRYRPNKEFFEAPIGSAVAALDRAAEALPVLRSQRNRGSYSPRSKPLDQVFPTVVRVRQECGQRNRVRTLAVPVRPRCGVCRKPLIPTT